MKAEQQAEATVLRSVNPATEEVMREFKADRPSDVERKLARAEQGFRSFRETSFAQRADWLNRTAALLTAEKERLGRLMAMEMGKTFRSAVQEAEKCAKACAYYAQYGEGFLADEEVKGAVGRSFVCFQPLGAILAVMPWNFPFWQVFRFAAPALMAGNVGLLKHASNVPQCALAIEEVFGRAGFPEHVFQTLLISSSQVGALIADPRVKAVTLTGSVEAGAQVAELAGKHIKTSVLELGGSDPFIVMPSADLERAAQVGVQARIINNGQSCIAAKRFIVDRRVADQFLGLFVDGMQRLKMGDPLDQANDLGPLATEKGRRSLKDQVARAVKAGAKVLLPGGSVEGRGYFYSPTVLTELSSESPGRHEEFFGPVALVFVVNGIEEAVGVANETRFGLGASVWTNDEREREFCIRRIESGLLFFNGMVASDPKMPFGGVKESGYGRELSHYGIKEFVNIKTVSFLEAAGGLAKTE